MRRDMMPWTPGKSLMPSEFFKGTYGTSFLEDFFNNSFMAGFSSAMRTDVKENDSSYILEVEMPGFQKENIRIECSDGRMTISAEHTQQDEEKKPSYIRQERHYGRVSRSFSFEGIDEDQVSAEYKDGILRITVPKQREPHKQSKQIDIH